MKKLKTFLVALITGLLFSISSNPSPALAEAMPKPIDPVVAIGPNNSGLFLSWKIDASRLYTPTTETKIAGSLDGVEWTPLVTQPWWKTTLSVTKLADSWKYFSIALSDGWAESDWTEPIDSTIHRKFFTTAQSLQSRNFRAQVVPQGYLFGWAEPLDQTGLDPAINTVQYVQIAIKKGKSTITANVLASPNMALIKSRIKPSESITGTALFVYRNGYIEKVSIKLSSPKVLPKLVTTKVDVNLLQNGRALTKVVSIYFRYEVTLVIQTSIKEPLFSCSVGLDSGTLQTRLDSSGTGTLTFPSTELSEGNGFSEMPISCSNPRSTGTTSITFTSAGPSCECWPQSDFLEFYINKK